MAGGLSPNDIDIRMYVDIVRRRKWVMLVVIVACVAASVLYSRQQAPSYRTSAELILRSRRSEQFLGSGVVNFNPDRDLSNEVRVIQSQPVRMSISAMVGRPVAASAAKSGDGTDVITLSLSGTDPKRITDDVNAYASGYVNFRRAQVLDELTASRQLVQAKIDQVRLQIAPIAADQRALDDAVAAAPTPAIRAQLEAERSDRAKDLSDRLTPLRSQEAQLQSQLDELQASSAITNGGIDLLDAAVVPTTPFAPNPQRSAVIAFGAGILLAVGAAFVLEQLDESLKSKDDLERVTNLPVLGLVPQVASWRASDKPYLALAEDPLGQASEAYRSLRTNITFLGLDRSVRIIQISSANAAESKTTTAANLAVAFAQASLKVVVVCCDLRRPRIHEFFGRSNSVGLTSVLLGQLPISEALQSVQVGGASLDLLASGPVPPNPADLLSSPRTADVLRQSLASYDIVILDSPPVLPVSDSLVISGIADATLIVSSMSKARRRPLRRAIELFRQVDAPLIGTSLTGVTSQGAYYSSYGYYGTKAKRGRGSRRDDPQAPTAPTPADGASLS